MALFILAPDANGNCCDCTSRTEPCDSCFSCEAGGIPIGYSIVPIAGFPDNTVIANGPSSHFSLSKSGSTITYHEIATAPTINLQLKILNGENISASTKTDGPDSFSQILNAFCAGSSYKSRQNNRASHIYYSFGNISQMTRTNQQGFQQGQTTIGVGGSSMCVGECGPAGFLIPCPDVGALAYVDNAQGYLKFRQDASLTSDILTSSVAEDLFNTLNPGDVQGFWCNGYCFPSYVPPSLSLSSAPVGSTACSFNASDMKDINGNPATGGCLFVTMSGGTCEITITDIHGDTVDLDDRLIAFSI